MASRGMPAQCLQMFKTRLGPLLGWLAKAPGLIFVPGSRVAYICRSSGLSTVWACLCDQCLVGWHSDSLNIQRSPDGPLLGSGVRSWFCLGWFLVTRFLKDAHWIGISLALGWFCMLLIDFLMVLVGQGIGFEHRLGRRVPAACDVRFWTLHWTSGWDYWPSLSAPTFAWFLRKGLGFFSLSIYTFFVLLIFGLHLR